MAKAEKITDRCPKCGGLSWFEWVEEDIVQRCLCGLHRYVAQRKDGQLVMHRVHKTQVSLPKPDSKLHETLSVLAVYYPTRMSTAEIAKQTGHNTKDTTSELSVLDHKALVERVEERKGLPGGSIWTLTNNGARLLRLLK
jgi:hypothetical protein